MTEKEMTHDIVRITSRDLPRMRELNAVFADAFGDAASYLDAPPSDAYLEALLARPHVIALAALKDGRVVGGLVAYVMEKFERERSEAYIYDLAVLEAHRRQGIARALIRETRRIAAEQGAWVVMVQADPGDDPAIRLYESLGTKEDVHHFDIPITGASNS